MISIKNKLPAIYVVNIEKLTGQECLFLSQFADDYIKQRVYKNKLNKNICAMVVANVLRKFLIYKHFNIAFDKQVVDFNKNGKPFLKDCDAKFNISHSGSFVVCAISNDEIGVDIQKITPFKSKIADYIFNEKTKNKIIQSNDVDLEFTKQWTKLESYLKLKGTGFANYDKNENRVEKHEFFYVDDYVVSVSYC